MIDRVSSLLRIQKPVTEDRGLLWVSGATVPTNGVDGYQVGCIFQKTDGGAGTALYINEGSVTSADFNAIAGGSAATTLAGLTDVGATAYTAGSVIVADGATAYAEVAISGDATLAANGALTIGANAIVTSYINNLAVTTGKLAAGAVTTGKVEGLTAGQIILGVDGTAGGNIAAVLSGDVTMGATGAVIISAGVVEDSMLEALASAQFFIGVDGTAANNTKVVMSGDTTMTNAGVVAIGANKVTPTMIANMTDGKIIIGVTATPNIAVAMSGDLTMDETGDVTLASSIAITNLDLGLSAGGAGSLDIFPTGGSFGKLSFVAADSGGNTTTTITNASQGGVRTYTIPDAGASTSFLMAVGGQNPIFTDVDAGADSIAGSVDVFPAGATSGKIAITCANSAGNTTTTIVNASQSGARTYTIPDAGASSTFLMEAGNQDAALKDIDAGASGTKGTVDIFPTTASRGKIAITAADDSGGDDTLTITNAAHGGAYTVTIPDAGASSEFVLSEFASTINGVKTFGSMPILPAATVAAAGSVRGNGPITTGITLVTGADATKVITLPPAVQGAVCIVKNNVANTLDVFPDGAGESINALAGGIAYNMGNVTAVMFCCFDGTDWFTLPLLAS